jgi:flagellar biogenesis protein FliO
MLLLFGQASAHAQALGQGGGVDVPLWRVAAALVLCIVLAVGAAFALRVKMRGRLPSVRGGSERRMRLVENLRLSHQVDLCLVELDGREIIVAATAQGASLLAGGSRTLEPEASAE